MYDALFMKIYYICGHNTITDKTINCTGMKRITLFLSGIFFAMVIFAQQSELDETIYRRFQFPLTDSDTRSTFFYFNGEWFPGANLEEVKPDQIKSVEIKEDEYGNRAIFLTVSQEIIEQIRSGVDDKLINLDPICEFPGGNGRMMEWISENMKIPQTLDGRVCVVTAIKILPDGTVSDAKILRPSNNEEANHEALRLVNSLPKFRVKYQTPYKEPLYYSLPITFSVPGSIIIR